MNETPLFDSLHRLPNFSRYYTTTTTSAASVAVQAISLTLCAFFPLVCQWSIPLLQITTGRILSSLNFLHFYVFARNCNNSRADFECEIIDSMENNIENANSIANCDKNESALHEFLEHEWPFLMFWQTIWAISPGEWMIKNRIDKNWQFT